MGSNFQRRLTETMRRLLEAQSRGDQLQQRLQELEAQLKKGGEDTRSVLSSDWSSGSCSQNRVSHNRTWSDLKQVSAAAVAVILDFDRSLEIMCRINTWLTKTKSPIYLRRTGPFGHREAPRLISCSSLTCLLWGLYAMAWVQFCGKGWHDVVTCVCDVLSGRHVWS